LTGQMIFRVSTNLKIDTLIYIEYLMQEYVRFESKNFNNNNTLKE